ncbi:SubName: Full=Uncharacterized protein {ECO:0000313/EMBL:CCA76292.1} [Serendipita indica DSM 11827]|nr:SubName: Full=Uncharacterized protein {ECO:0000313/EMBL:CCA76292.1} [Serendipita indica DSM 11827]
MTKNEQNEDIQTFEHGQVAKGSKDVATGAAALGFGGVVVSALQNVVHTSSKKSYTRTGSTIFAFGLGGETYGLMDVCIYGATD